MNNDLNSFLDRIKAPAFFVAFLVVAHLFRLITDGGVSLGIFPRALDSIGGILFMPLIHDNWGHLLANSLPLLITGSFLMIFYPSIAVRSFVMMYFLTGVSIWLFATGNQYHIGASGVLYAMVSFLFWSGVFRWNNRAIFLALTILTLYGSMFEGIDPNLAAKGISWDGHLAGGIVGIFVAYYFKNELEQEEKPQKKWATIDAADRPYFFERDTFDMTKIERKAMEEERQRQAWLEQQAAIQQWTQNQT